MNDSLPGVVFRIVGHGLACVAAIRGRNLESLTALRTANQHNLALPQFMEPLEEMDAPERNPLASSAEIACEGNPSQPLEHDHPGTGCQTG